MATRNVDNGLFVLCQGHPEYGTLSLLREYRRDVRRCVFGRGAVAYPQLPEGYLGPEAVATLEGFKRRAAATDVDPRETCGPPSPTTTVAATCREHLGRLVGHPVLQLAAPGTRRPTDPPSGLRPD